MSRFFSSSATALPTVPSPVGPAPAGVEGPPERMSLAWLVGAALLTVAAWQLPYGDYIAYPFTILATWFHEMGHGLTAMLLGGHFERLDIYSNGSGVAHYSAPAGEFLLGRVRDALVAGAGPMGPPIAGALLILSSRRFSVARITLIALGTFMLLSTVLWVRSVFGLAFIPLLAAGILAIALKAPRWSQGFTIQLLGVEACVSTFRQMDYLFSSSATIGGRVMPSDSSQIALNLLLPYWFWGGLMAISSLLLLMVSLYVAYRPAGRRNQREATVASL